MRCTLTGIGQIMLCDNPKSGGVFLTAIGLQAPLLAAGAFAGSALGSLSRALLRYGKSDWRGRFSGWNVSKKEPKGVREGFRIATDTPSWAHSGRNYRLPD